jgi:hypothetical protein
VIGDDVHAVLRRQSATGEPKSLPGTDPSALRDLCETFASLRETDVRTRFSQRRQGLAKSQRSTNKKV